VSQVLPISIPELHGKPDDMTLQQRRADQNLTVSPDGRHVFINFRAGTSRSTRWFNYVFSAASGQVTATGDARPFSLPSINDTNLLAGIVTFPTHDLSPGRQEITIYRLPTLSKVLSFPAPVQGIASLAWSPAGDRLAGGADGLTHPREEESIRVWDTISGARLAGFVGKFEPVGDVAWHPSGRFFLSESSKNIGERGSLLQLLPADGGTPLLQHFAPVGLIISGPCFCPRTGHLAWHQRGQILIHEIQGL
jgi:WD40 repeat protein